MQNASWMDARARLKFEGTPKILTVDAEGRRRATAMLCQTKFGLREMPLMNEPSDFAWSDEAALRDLVKLFVGERKPFFLERVPVDSPTLPALRKATKGRFWLRADPAPPTPYLDTRGKTINDLVKSGRRSDLRRAEKRLAKCGTVTYELRAPRSKQDLDKLIDETFDVETRSWKHDMGTCLTSPAEATYAAAFRGFVEDAYAEGHIRFAFVRLDGKAVAMQIASEWQHRYWIYKATFDKAYSKASPGNLLVLVHTRPGHAKGPAVIRIHGEDGQLDQRLDRRTPANTSASTVSRTIRAASSALPFSAGGWPGDGSLSARRRRPKTADAGPTKPGSGAFLNGDSATCGQSAPMGPARPLAWAMCRLNPAHAVAETGIRPVLGARRGGRWPGR